MAKTQKSEWQVPYVVREAMAVAQVTAQHVILNHSGYGEDHEWKETNALAVPITVRLKTSHLDKPPTDNWKKYGEAKVYFYLGGVAVTVNMVSTYDSFGESWWIDSVKARFNVIRGEGHGQDDDKTEMNWSGKSLDELAKLWGEDPQRWQYWLDDQD